MPRRKPVRSSHSAPAPESSDISPDVAPISRRILATAIDASPLVLLTLVATTHVAFFSQDQTIDRTYSLTYLWAGGFFILLLAFMAYSTICIARSGRTLGKRLLRLRVIKPGRERVGWGSALMREVVTKVFIPAMLLFGNAAVFPLAVLLVLASGFVRKDRRTLSDLLAGTEVIDERPVAMSQVPLDPLLGDLGAR